MSSFTSETVMPKSARSGSFFAYLALSSSALVGMQPIALHTPPSLSASMQATFMPSCAARIAAT